MLCTRGSSVGCQLSLCTLHTVTYRNLFLLTLYQDDDLRELRDTREWLDMLSTVKGGMTREQKVLLRAEAKVRNPYEPPYLLFGLRAGVQGSGAVETGMTREQTVLLRAWLVSQGVQANFGQ